MDTDEHGWKQVRSAVGSSVPKAVSAGLGFPTNVVEVRRAALARQARRARDGAPYLAWEVHGDWEWQWDRGDFAI